MPSVEESVATIRAELKYLKEQGSLSESAYKDIEALLPRGRPAPAITTEHSLEVVQAIYAFQPQQDGDLALQPGDTIEILEKLSPEWYKGRCNGKVGVFPSNYVQSVEKSGATNKGSAIVVADASASPSPVPAPPQYGGYTAPPVQQQQQQQYPPQFTGYYQQGPPIPAQSQQYPPQQYPPQQVATAPPAQQQPHQGSEAFKKFGSKLGNAAIFGAGATLGSDLVNGIFR